MDKKFTVLIIDDDTAWSDVLKKHLSEYPQFDVLNPISDGENGLLYITNSKPDVIILDLMLPI